MKLLDLTLCALGAIEMLVNDRCLRLSEADEVYDVGKYLDEARMRGSIEVRERKVFNAALYSRRVSNKTKTRSDHSHLLHELSQHDEESHKLSCVCRKNSLCVVTAHVLCCGLHRRCNNLPGR